MVLVRYMGGEPSDLITKNITENGIYNASSDGADGYSQVNVNVPSKVALDFDFTQSNIDKVLGITSQLFNAVRTEDGLIIDNINGYATIPNYMLRPVTNFILDISELNILDTSRHNRLFMFTGNDVYNSGWIYRSTGFWGTYDNTNGWLMSDINDPNYFDDSELQITIDQNGYWHIYKNGILCYETPSPINFTNRDMSIGSSNNSINYMLLKQLIIY